MSKMPILRRVAAVMLSALLLAFGTVPLLANETPMIGLDAGEGEDVFLSNMTGLIPGESHTEQVRLRNISNDTATFYLSAESAGRADFTSDSAFAQSNELLALLDMKVELYKTNASGAATGSGSVLYEGKAHQQDGANALVGSEVLLGNLKASETVLIAVTITVPESLNNTHSGAVAKFWWHFNSEADEDGGESSSSSSSSRPTTSKPDPTTSGGGDGSGGSSSRPATSGGGDGSDSSRSTGSSTGSGTSSGTGGTTTQTGGGGTGDGGGTGGGTGGDTGGGTGTPPAGSGAGTGGGAGGTGGTGTTVSSSASGGAATSGIVVEEPADNLPDDTDESVDLDDGTVPLGNLESADGWSLLNLILCILSLLMAAVLVAKLVLQRKREREEEEQADATPEGAQAAGEEDDSQQAWRKRHTVLHVVSTVLGVVPGVCFLLLENFTRMQFISRWTPLIVTLVLVQLAASAVTFLLKQPGQKEENKA